MDSADQDALPRGMALLWGIDDRQRRGPRPTLTIRDIAAAAVRIADEEGLPAVSMGKVATALGFTTMSLYRYVDSKEDLFLVMLDEAYGPPPSERVGPDWRSGLTSWCESNRAALLRHPWILQVPLDAPPVAPNLVAWMDRGLSALRGTGLPQQERLSSLLLAEVYVRGQVQLMGAFSPSGEDDVYAARMRRVLEPGRFPELEAALSSGALEDDGDEDEFRFGLDTVLLGIQRLIDDQPGK